MDPTLWSAGPLGADDPVASRQAADALYDIADRDRRNLGSHEARAARISSDDCGSGSGRDKAMLTVRQDAAPTLADERAAREQQKVLAYAKTSNKAVANLELEVERRHLTSL